MPVLAQHVALGGLVGVASGIASALFLKALDQATSLRQAHESLIYGLPLAGLLLGLVYDRWGKAIKAGNNLVLDTIHENLTQIPLRMAPMVFVGTVLTHLFGGSAGREGTAVQMGASLADWLSHRLAVKADTRRQLLAAGMAAGFGSVFGTPIAGALFGLEVVCIGKLEYDALAPALVGSLVGDYVTRHLGVVHTHYLQVSPLQLTPLVFGKLVSIGVAMAFVAFIFVELTERTKHFLERTVTRLAVRLFIGGATLVALWKLCGTSDYLGLGIPLIVRSFSDPQIPIFAFALKILFTSITLASGFLGGEVTPLFFVGASLGSVLSRSLGLPLDLGAGVGMAAVFGAAANTPLSLSVMAAELLGIGIFPHVVIVCVTAYLLSGQRGIYPAQRILRAKHGGAVLVSAVTLRDYHSKKPGP
jgi:H+/Cl- antiporter ClcA